MNNNSKRETNFFSRWRVTRNPKATSTPLQLAKYADLTKPVFFSFSQSLNECLDCGTSLSRTVRFDLCPTNPSVTVSFGSMQCSCDSKFFLVISYIFSITYGVPLRSKYPDKEMLFQKQKNSRDVQNMMPKIKTYRSIPKKKVQFMNSKSKIFDDVTN